MGSSLQFAVRRLQAGRQQRLSWTGPTSRTSRTRLGKAAAGLPERALLREELPAAVLKYFVPFKDFFGGWLVYELAGRLWRQYATPAEMRAAGVGFTEAI